MSIKFRSKTETETFLWTESLHAENVILSYVIMLILIDPFWKPYTIASNQNEITYT